MTDQEAERLQLAHRLLEMCKSDVWRDVILPYLEKERDTTIANMASQTDSLQLMRYAGSMQTLNSLLGLEKQSRQIINGGIDRKVRQFN